MQESTLVQRAYTAVAEHFVKTGKAPHYTELAAILSLQPEEARQVQHGAYPDAGAQVGRTGGQITQLGRERVSQLALQG